MPKYDLAVAGGGFGGLAAAALMSSNGKKVIVYDPGSSPDVPRGGRVCDGFRFFRGPSLSYGFEPGGALRNLFSQLGGVPLPALLSAPCFQVALPDRRITIFSNEEETIDELRREFPGEIRSIVRFYGDIKKEAERVAKSRFSSYWAKRKPAVRFIKKYGFSKELILFFDVQSRYFFQKPLDQLSTATLILLCETMPMQLSGVNSALAEHCLSIVRKNGGQVRLSTEQIEVAFKNNRAVGFAANGNVTEATTVLVCSENPAPTYYLGIFDDVVPVSMVRDVLYLPDYARPEEFLALSLSAQDDAASAPRSGRALTVSVHAKSSAEKAHIDVMGSLNDIIPFLKDNLYFTEQAAPATPSFRLPGDVSYKRAGSSNQTGLFYKSSRRNLYALQETQHIPMDLLPVLQRFIKRIS